MLQRNQKNIGMAQALLNFKLEDTIRHYKVLQVIGSGGFAIIVQAYDTKHKREVAIKIISRSAAAKNDYLLYLEQELRLCTRFNHPNIVKGGFRPESPLNFL